MKDYYSYKLNLMHILGHFEFYDYFYDEFWKKNDILKLMFIDFLQ